MVEIFWNTENLQSPVSVETESVMKSLLIKVTRLDGLNSEFFQMFGEKKQKEY